jgi:RNA polymerase sigma-70 factor (ECF subfamily)
MPGTPQLTDDLRSLIRRCLDGGQAAMIELVERFQGQVFGLCYRMLGQRQDAEDVAQETFIRALRSLHTWDSERDFEPWLLAIAGNRCRTALATRMRRPAVQMLIDNVAGREPDLQAAESLAEEVELALCHLRPEHRQAFLLFHQNELSYVEIAEAMDCPVGTIRTWIHRARRELVDRLRSRGVLEESPSAVRKV